MCGVPMTRALLSIAICAAACTTEVIDTTQSASTTPVDWMLGTWHCSAQYHDVAPFVAHTSDVTYTFVADPASRFLVHTTYAEAASHEDPVSLTIAGTWSFGAPFPSGVGPITVDAIGSDGSSTHGTGFYADSGWDTNTSTYTGPDGVARGNTFSTRVQPDGSWLAFAKIKPTFATYLDLTCRRDAETQSRRPSGVVARATGYVDANYQTVCDPFDPFTHGCGIVETPSGDVDLFGETAAFDWGVGGNPFQGASRCYPNDATCAINQAYPSQTEQSPVYTCYLDYDGTMYCNVSCRGYGYTTCDVPPYHCVTHPDGSEECGPGPGSLRGH